MAGPAVEPIADRPLEERIEKLGQMIAAFFDRQPRPRFAIDKVFPATDDGRDAPPDSNTEVLSQGRAISVPSASLSLVLRDG